MKTNGSSMWKWCAGALMGTLVFASAVSAQTSSQTFGSGTGTHTSQTGSLTFLPLPTTSGTGTWTRAGAVAPNAPIVLANTGNPLGTANSYVRAVASSSTSVSKFSPILGYTGSAEFYTSFKVLFGDSAAGTTATTGSWTFYQGAGAMYSDAADFAGASVFASLRATYAASGVVNLNYRGGGAWITTGMTTTNFSQGTVYTIEIVGNNKSSGTISYTYNGVAQTVAVQKFDLFINGVRVGDDLSQAQMTAGANIDRATFIGISSTANAANIFVDDVVTYNAVPATIGTGSSAPSVSTVAASGVAATAATANGNVTADGGDTVTERGVVYKTSSGVAITDNPTAAVAGGTGNYSVDLSSLSVNQIYYFRAYAINSVGTTLAANELNFTTLANVPAAPTVGNPTATTLDVAVNANGNPAGTQFAIQRTSDDQYLQANGTFGVSAVWQTAATWDTTTATGLSPSTEYSFQVKARNGANVETAFGTAASESTIAAPTGIWINPMSAGTPMGSYYLGDTLGEWYVNFEIGQTWWDYAQLGIGTSTGGTSYNWGEASWYQDGDGDNKRVRRNLSGYQFTSAANHYVICQAKAYSGDDYTSKSGSGWGNSTLYPPEDLASAYFAVSAINDASAPAAEANDADPTGAIDLGWSKNAQGHNVMVVRKAAAASWTEPTQGTSYAVTDALGAGTVVYVGADTSTTDSGLSAGSTYDYKFYSVNGGYYAAGVTAQGETLPCEPDAPTGLHASETNATSFTATWTASDRATGYRLDVSENALFSGEGEAEPIFTESMGTVASTTTIAAHETANGFDNDAYTMSAGGIALPGDIRATSSSSGYTGASGAANVWFPSTAGSYGFGIAGIDASGYDSLRLSFGYRKESASANATFAVEYSTDGSTWNPITVSGLPAADASTGWYLISNLELPAGAVSATLQLRWVKSGSVAMRIDDVVLQGVTAAVAFVDGYENLAVAGTSQLVEGLLQNSTYYFRVRAEGEGGCPGENSATASVTTTVQIGGSQTIDFAAITDKVTTDAVELSATASSGLPVSFSVFSGPAEIGMDGVTLTFTGAGEVSIVASQAGDEDWDAADDVTRTFNVTKALATVTLSDLAQAYDGTARNATVTTVPEGLTVSVTYDGEATVPTDPGSYEVIATVVDDIYQGSDTDTLVVSVAAPASFSATAAGLSSIDLAFAANAAGNDVVIVANGTGTFGTPSGTPPAAGQAFAGGTVVYVGTSSPQTDTDLSSCTPYYYKAWSQIDGFYSAGLTDDAATTGPDAPTGLGAVADYTSFVASWGASAGATGYRLDVSTEANFATGGGAGSVYLADFEDSTKGSYALGAITNNGVVWMLDDAMIGTLAADRKNGGRSVRIRSNETQNAYGLYMVQDRVTGLSSITLQYGVYGTDGSSTGRVEYSTNGGANWISAGTFAATSTNLATFSVTNLNVTGNVRVRVLKASGGTTARLNVDDVRLYPYDPPMPSFVAGYEDLAVAGTSQEVAGLEEGTTYYFRVRAEGDGGCTSANSATAGTTTLLHLRMDVSPLNVNVREGGEGRFFVRLNKDPEGTVIVNVARSSGDESIAISGGAARSFKSSNWNAWQAVILSAPEDENAVSETATFTVSAVGLDPVFVEAATLDDDIGENMALASSGSTISASERNSRPEQLIDGIHTSSVNYGFTIWTNIPQGTITLDLKVASTVSRIRLLNWNWVRRVHRYTIESSLNGETWSTLIDASGSDRQGWDDWPVANQTVRYLRFTGRSSSEHQAAVSISELEVYGTRDLSNLPRAVLSESEVNVREGGEGRFFVRLDKEPEGVVVLNVERYSGSTNVTIQGGAIRTFRASNWNGWQAVVLAAPKDDNAIGEVTTFRISSAGVPDQFVEATILDDGIGQNLALASAGATISGAGGASRAAQLIDGVHTVSTNYGYTIWTNEPAGTLTLELLKPATVTRIRLLNWNWVHRVHRYQMECSTDGLNWSLLADASDEDRQGWDDWIVDNVSFRYLRFTGLSNSANHCVVISELEVYGTYDPQDSVVLSKSAVNVREGGTGRFFVRLPAAPTDNVVVTISRISGDNSIVVSAGALRGFRPSNWNAWQAVVLSAGEDENSINETATFRISAPGYADTFIVATALDGDIGENLALASGGATISGTKANLLPQVIDGVFNTSANYGYTVWNEEPPGTMLLDLGGVMSVSRVRLLNWDWTYRVHRYRIEASTDGVTWAMLADASAADRHGWDDWAVANESIRYLRFTGLANSANSFVCISELEVYGTRPEAPGGTSKTLAMSLESIPVSVLTSDGPEDQTGWLAVDGDPETAWVGQKAGGGYLVIEYAPALTLKALAVDVTEDSLADAQILYSQDAEAWQALPEDLDMNPVSLNFLWVVFPDDGTDAVPEVLEIWPNP